MLSLEDSYDVDSLTAKEVLWLGKTEQLIKYPLASERASSYRRKSHYQHTTTIGCVGRAIPCDDNDELLMFQSVAARVYKIRRK